MNHRPGGKGAIQPVAKYRFYIVHAGGTDAVDMYVIAPATPLDNVRMILESGIYVPVPVGDPVPGKVMSRFVPNREIRLIEWEEIADDTEGPAPG